MNLRSINGICQVVPWVSNEITAPMNPFTGLCACLCFHLLPDECGWFPTQPVTGWESPRVRVAWFLITWTWMICSELLTLVYCFKMTPDIRAPPPLLCCSACLLSVLTGRGLCVVRDAAQEHDVETAHGVLHVTMRGAAKGNRPTILTYHDIGLNRE